MQTPRRRYAVALAAWLGIAATVAAVSFVAVDRSDDRVVQPVGSPDLVPPPPGAGPPSDPASDTPSEPPTGSTTSVPRTTTTSPSTRVPSAVGSPSVPSGTTRTPYGAAPAPTQRPVTSPPRPSVPVSTSPAPPRPPSPSSPAPPTRPTRSQTFRTGGGTITASCTGSVLRVTSVVPSKGWRASQTRGDGRVEVVFTDGGRKVTSVLVCFAGFPLMFGG